MYTFYEGWDFYCLTIFIIIIKLWNNQTIFYKKGALDGHEIRVLKWLTEKVITHCLWRSVTYVSVLFQVGYMQGVPVACWAHAWSALYVPVFLSTSSTSKFISVMSTVWIKVLFHVRSVVNKWRTVAVCVYMSTNNTAKNFLPQNSSNMRLHMVLESEINWKCP